MTWEEYLQKYDKNIDGNVAYIADIRVADGGNKFIRNVSPTKVLIRSNDKLEKQKTIYYSNFHFLKMKGDKTLKQIIAPYDNTGYRYFAGTAVNIFEDYKECVEFYNKQVDEASEVYNARIREIENQRDKLQELKIKEDI